MKYHELDTIEEIVKEYQDINSEIDNIQELLEKISKRKSVLLERLNELRKYETSFMNHLKEKYSDEYIFNKINEHLK